MHLLAKLSDFFRRRHIDFQRMRTRLAREREFDRHGFVPLSGTYAEDKKFEFERPQRIHIVSDAPIQFGSKPYFLTYIALRWQRKGYAVTVGAPARLPDADLACLHIDATRNTAEAEAVFAHYPRVLNGGFTDNSKRVLSHRLLDRYSSYQGPVILKTDANFGGMPEAHARFTHGIPEELIARDLGAPHVDWARVQYIPSANYFVLEHKDQVPDAVWTNPHLVVEQFTPEVDPDGLYCMRACVFFGNREASILVRSKESVIKGRDIVAREWIKGHAPAEIQAFKQKHNMDFGRIDYVLHKGEVIILDANKTATLSRDAAVGFADILVHPLAEGLAAYV